MALVLKDALLLLVRRLQEGSGNLGVLGWYLLVLGLEEKCCVLH